jgi:hypothetical protein
MMAAHQVALSDLVCPLNTLSYWVAKGAELLSARYQEFSIYVVPSPAVRVMSTL